MLSTSALPQGRASSTSGADQAGLGAAAAPSSQEGLSQPSGKQEEYSSPWILMDAAAPSAGSTAQGPSCAQVPAGGAQPGQVENTGFSSCRQHRAVSAALHGEFGKLLLLQPVSTVNPSLPLAANSLIQQSKIIDVPITPQLPIGLSILRAAGKLKFPFYSCLNKLMHFSSYVN